MFKYIKYISVIFLSSIIIQCSNDSGPIDIPEDNNPRDTINIGGTDDRFYTSDTYIVDDIFVEVYVPSDYDSTQKYPIIYLNDGDLFAEIYAQLTILDSDPFIMVGLSDDRSRQDRFLPYYDPGIADNLGQYTPSASEYSKSIVEEVIPFIESQYNIQANKRAIFGISFGGLHATWIAIQHPGVFSFVGALSPSYWVRGRAIFTEPLFRLNPSGPSLPTTLYIDRGTAEWRDYLPFIGLLKDEGLTYGRSLFYYEVPGGDHTVFDWTFRIDIPFKLFMGGTPSISEAQLDAISYCVEFEDSPGVKYGRVNPMLKYTNGITYSVITEAQYSITSGTGTVGRDGSFFINDGNQMEIEIQYESFNANLTLSRCN